MGGTVSLVVVTGSGAARAHALLALLRPHVDEVVLGVDLQRAPETAAVCAPLADQVHTFDSPETGSAPLADALIRARGDWILRLDDDEVPGTALLEALPELARDRQVSQFLLKRRWLWPDGEHVIGTFPWGIEPAGRLTRNVRGTFWVRGGVHTDEEVLGERRLLDLDFYHADLLLSPEPARRRKALRYEALRPGLRYGDFPVNAIYLPEAASELELRPVPAADRPLVARLLAPPPVQAPPTPPAVPHVDARTLARANLDRLVSPGAYGATVTVPDPPGRLRAGAVHHLEVVVTNDGDEVWLAGDVPSRPIRLGWRWRAPGGEVLQDGRDLLTETVRPGETTRRMLTFRTPAHEGRHVLEVDLVHEHVRWFGAVARVEVELVAGPAASLSAPGLRDDVFDLERGEVVRALREELAAARARVADLEARERREAAFRATRRYRAGLALGRLADRVRRAR